MPKAQYKNRLDKLFSNINLVDPAPESEITQESPVNEDCQDVTMQVKDLGVQALGDLPESTQSGQPVVPEGKPAETDWDLLQKDGSRIRYTPDPIGWGEFLDGIRRSEQIGYVYEQSEVKELAKHPDQQSETNDLLNAPIAISGEEIGQLLLEGDATRAWTAEDKELVNSVVQQLSQQIETLRLLDEAQRSRSEAEQAFLRLARQSGQPLAAKDESTGELPSLADWAANNAALDFVYEDAENPVQPASLAVDEDAPVLKAPIRMGEEIYGALQVVGKQDLSPDDADLVETVAQRLSQQVENLRLLEEARHFQNETEDAIRQLTYRSWQAYLAAASKANLGFEYDRNKILPLEADSPLTGNAFPLKVREEVIGQLAVEGGLPQQDEASNLINVIGDRLSAHLDGLRLAEQREQALAETEMLYGISSRLSTAQSLEDALASVSEPAREAGARDSRLFFVTLDERGQPEGLTLASIWYPEDGAQLVPVSAHFLLDDYPAYWQILQDPFNPMLIDDVLIDPRLEAETRDLFIKTGARAAAVLPLSISGRWVGAIFINWEAPHAFSEQENRLYAALSRQAAVVVNNRLLLEQTRKRAQELQTVAQVSTAASTILDPQELLQAVVDLTKSSFSLYHAQVYLHHEDEGFLEVFAGAGEIGRRIAAQRAAVPLHSGIVAARAARERQVLIINDSQNEPGYVSNSLLPEVRSEIALPMVVGDRLLGVFNVQANATNRFNREDARTYTTLASQVAVALQNAELYAEQAATVERLRELDHLKSAFLANMSHELRTPLNSILGFAEVLLLELDGPLNETMNNDVHLIEKNGKHLLSLINDVLDMAKIEAGKMNLTFEKFALRDLIEDALDITSSLAREKALYLVIDQESQDKMNLIADRVRIRQVLINVIANAVKFTEKGGISICVVQLEAERKMQIRVKDTGIGIPPDKLELIFESFSQVDTSTTRKAGGTGLGLPISRRLVEMHGGRLWAESTGLVGQGSLFIIELPFEATKQSL